MQNSPKSIDEKKATVSETSVTGKVNVSGQTKSFGSKTQGTDFKKKLGKRKRRKRRNIIIAIVIVLVVVLAVVLWRFLARGQQPQLDPNAIYSGDILDVERRDVSDTVSLDGTLQSAKSVSIYSTLNAAVTSLKVKEGDVVKRGELLAQLDTGATVKEIASQQAAIKDAQISKQNEIDQARETYQNFADALKNGTNTDIVTAQKAIKTAQASYAKAKKAFEQMKEDKKEGMTEAVLTQERAMRDAFNELQRMNLSSAKIAAALKEAEQARNLQSLIVAGDAAEESQLQKQLKLLTDKPKKTPEDYQAINKIRADIEEIKAQAQENEAKKSDAQDKYDSVYSEQKENKLKVSQAVDNLASARRQYRLALRHIDQQLADAQDAVATAEDGILEAKTGLHQAEITAQQQNRANQRALEAAQLGASSNAKGQQDIAKLRADISSATIKSPISGVITQLNAKVGSAPQGALMTVEDTQNLVVKSAVKEKDVAKLSVGQQVIFKTPATGDREYTGTVSFISPAASTNGSAASANSDANTGMDNSGETRGNATFPLEIKVTGDITGLRLGSSVKAKVIVANAANALAVPASAIVAAPTPVSQNDGGSGDSVPANGAGSGGPKVMLDAGAPQAVQAEANKSPIVSDASGAAGGASTADPNATKSVLVLENASSQNPTVKEVPVTVLVSGSGYMAIQGEGLTEETKVLNNAMQYLHLAGGKAKVTDIDPSTVNPDEMPQG